MTQRAGEADIRVVHITSEREADITPIVQSVTWTGDTTQVFRELDVSTVNTVDGRQRHLGFREGHEIRFYNHDVELFRGPIFSRDVDSTGVETLICYDYNVYLTKNADTRKFTNQTAAQITRRLCRDFDVPTGALADTGYVIPKMTFEEKSLRDMIITAITETERQTGRYYVLGNDQGRVTLNDRRQQIRQWVLENGTNILDAGYTTSIDDLRNRVKVVYEGDNPTVITRQNQPLINRYGSMQHVETVSDDKTRSQLDQLARQLLADLATIEDSASINALGIDEVVAGVSVYVRESMTGIAGGYYVSDDSHTFSGRSHTMSITLSADPELPRLTYEPKEGDD